MNFGESSLILALILILIVLLISSLLPFRRITFHVLRITYQGRTPSIVASYCSELLGVPLPRCLEAVGE
jgi:hypothetical protein